MSRPNKTIDWTKVDQLLMAGCTGTQIAPHFDMHPDTFYRRVMEEYGIGFTDYSSLKKSHGDSLLLAKQYELAIKGDKVMLIWLGKQRLGQRENLDKTNAENEKKLDTILSELKVIKLKEEECDLKQQAS